MLPKKIILGCNLHGEIILKNKEFEVKPLDINLLIQLNAVTCGVANISTLENYDNISKDIDKYITSNPLNWDEDIEQTEILNYVKNIKEILSESDRENFISIQKEYRRQKKDKDSSQQNYMKDYIHTSDKSYKITTFTQGQNISNKLFYKFSEEELDLIKTDDIDLEDVLFNKLFIYNTENKQDVFELLASLGFEYNEISLFNLLDLFKELGVENIIIIDLSCEVFKDNNKLSDREKRNLRNIMFKKELRQKKGGKNKSKRPKKYRTRTIKRKNKY